MPTFVLCGENDNDIGSADRLIEALPDARRAVSPGRHLSSVTEPSMRAALVGFLGG